MEYDDGTKARARDGSALLVGPVLYATNKHIEESCKSVNKFFMQCKQDDRNPRSCLNQGKEVIDCVNRVVRSVDAKCPAQLTAYARCMDKNHCHFEKCREEQAALESCMPLN
mmetsp:Transcript_10358/g.34539  ORF Transcript_10358/g.34539 Transcript_10358/m.34539 type:complete len:112 (+) Transcript_10358:42-377(+)